jgi:hypothetical protein
MILASVYRLILVIVLAYSHGIRTMNAPSQPQKEFNFSPDIKAHGLAEAATSFATTNKCPKDASLAEFTCFCISYQENGFNENFGTHSRTISQDPLRVQALLLLIGDPTENNEVAETLFYSAAIEGHIDTLRFFINNGYGIRSHQRGFDDMSRRTTALHHAAFHGRLETVTLLADNGADLNQIGLVYIGMTALELAQDENHTAVVNFLRARGALERPRPTNIVSACFWSRCSELSQ